MVGDFVAAEGVTVGSQTRQGQTAVGFPRLKANGEEELDAQGHRIWDNVDDTVQAIVMLRKNEQSLPAVRDVKTKYAEVNQPGKILPGVKLETFWSQQWPGTHVIWCKGAQNPGEAHQRRTAEKLGGKFDALDTGHYPMLSMPAELTQMLLQG